jgi:hypothetical protein
MKTESESANSSSAVVESKDGADEKHVRAEVLQAGLGAVQASPKTGAVLELIVRRPRGEMREVLDEARLDEVSGLEGDNWGQRGSSRTADGRAHPEMQLTIMNSRLISLIAGSRERWALAGDQLFVDLDLSAANLPAGTRLKVGETVIEITAQPHTGCGKFKARFGADAMAFVNSPLGRELRLRGANARIVSGGVIRVGDRVAKV